MGREPPDVHYAVRGGHHLAYTVTGTGPIDLVYLLGFVSHLDLLWEHPAAARFLDRLGRFCRLVVVDKRGTGLSDRVGDVPIPEEQVGDLVAVMDAVGMDRPALLGTQDGFLVGALLAATDPERVHALVGISTGAAGPEQWPTDGVERLLRGLEKYWGRQDAPMNYWAPRVWRTDPSFRRWWARYSRAAGGPTTAVRVIRNYIASDIRPILPAIRVPTLIVHNQTSDVNHTFARQLAEGIAGAQFLELPAGRSVGLFPWLEGGDEVAAAIEEFLTGHPATPMPDRVLATVLFTDVVQSTVQAAQLGDHRWNELLDRHDATIDRALARFGGRLVKYTGDGVLATFDGPARAIHCAASIRDVLAGEGVEVRSGVHTGEIELRGEDIGGLAVHIAARVMGQADPQEILASRTVKDLVVGSGIAFRPRGTHELKGVPERWALFSAEP
jgi:class 3 adenylate cyclase